jgi:enoyl-CoA hydratase/carnithine racemase
MTYADIIYEKQGPIAHITLNRPGKMNALNTQPGGLLEQWEDACSDAKNDKTIRVVVIKGAGRCFSAGYDISTSSGWVGSPVDEERYDYMADHVNRYFRVLWESPKVFIAQVHGFCLAGAGDMACFCDLTVASEDAQFGYPAVRYGVLPTTFVWPFMIGMKKTRELAYTGNMMSAQEALSYGLVNKVVPKDELDEEVSKLADAIVQVPAMTTKLTKISVNNMFEIMGIRQAVQQSRELDLHVMSSAPPELEEFFRISAEKGLKAALEWRDSKFANVTDDGQKLRVRKYKEPGE